MDVWSDTLVLVYYGQCVLWLPKPPMPPHPVYYVLMNQTETNVFFRLLHDLEDERNTYADETNTDPEYQEGYDYVMDIVKDAIFEGDEVKNMYDLDNFVNQVDAYAVDFDGEYGKGYQAAVDLCLEAVSQLIESDKV
jgi:hypothetical protein